jgi:hypothetical protein
MTTFAVPLARYRFTARMHDDLPLPDYAGSLLRGVFGAALRRSACMTQLPACGSCPLLRSCPYPAIFETPAQDTQLAQRFTQLPNPYIIEPDPIGARTVGKGALMEFNMVLVGQHVLGQLPLIIHAWQRALQHGLGKRRVPGTLEKVVWLHGEDSGTVVFASEEGRVRPHEPVVEVPLEQAPRGSATLEIVTPLRLQHQGHALAPARLAPRTLASALLRRISLVLEVHGSQCPAPFDASRLTACAEALADNRQHLRWHDWTRYSSRQHQEMTLGGVVGRWELEGEQLGMLWPWLWLGQWLHVGKNATMGMGRYVLQE